MGTKVDSGKFEISTEIMPGLCVKIFETKICKIFGHKITSKIYVCDVLGNDLLLKGASGYDSISSPELNTRLTGHIWSKQ